jgi:putative salt-induced outer membrane protein
MRKLKLAAAFAVLFVPTTVLADGLFGELSAGFLATGGNSETRSTNIKTQLGYISGNWRQEGRASALQSRDSGETTSERYTASYKLDFSFTENDYLFITTDYEKDLFGGVRERLSESVGYGRKLINTSAHRLEAEIGAGARQTRFQNPAGGRENEAIGRLSGAYRWIISSSSEFSQRLRVESGKENTFTEAVSEMKLSIIGNLFASLSFTLRNNTDVAPDRKRTDTFTAVNLSYKFGQP